jgi:2-dehydro-3-deoxygluconokinase
MRFDVLTLGEAMVLFAAEQAGPLAQVGRFHRYSAGAELNVAIGLARLGLSVGYLSRVGADSFGQFLLDTLTAEGVSTALVLSCEGQRTGFMLKGRTADGSDPEIEYHRRGSAASGMGLDDLARLGAARVRHLHLTGISPALSGGCHELVFEALHWARSNGVFVSFDPNLRPRLWPSVAEMTSTVNELAALCDLVLPGLEEGRRLTGLQDAEAIAEHYLAHGASQVVVKLGARGAWCAGLPRAPEARGRTARPVRSPCSSSRRSRARGADAGSDRRTRTLRCCAPGEAPRTPARGSPRTAPAR